MYGLRYLIVFQIIFTNIYLLSYMKPLMSYSTFKEFSENWCSLRFECILWDISSPLIFFLFIFKFLSFNQLLFSLLFKTINGRNERLFSLSLLLVCLKFSWLCIFFRTTFGFVIITSVFSLIYDNCFLFVIANHEKEFTMFYTRNYYLIFRLN
jgi:hypothetical protein